MRLEQCRLDVTGICFTRLGDSTSSGNPNLSQAGLERIPGALQLILVKAPPELQIQNCLDRLGLSGMTSDCLLAQHAYMRCCTHRACMHDMTMLCFEILHD